MRTLNPAVIAAIIATGLVFSSSPSFAALPQEKTVTWYDVELIVFRNLDTRSTETWPPDAGAPDVADARPLFPASTNASGESRPDALATLNADMPTPYVPLDESAHQLSGILGSLQRSSKYEPLLHVAWTQPPLEREQAPVLRLTLPDALASGEEPGNAPDSREPLDKYESSESDVAPEDLPAFLQDQSGANFARPLDGTVQLSVSRYLHLDLDLLYLPDDLNLNVLGGATPATRDWTEEEKAARDERRRDILEALARGDITIEEAEILSLEPDEQIFQGFRVNQYRRLRSREVHYFDHPVLGVIVVVTPREVSAAMMDSGMPQPDQ